MHRNVTDLYVCLKCEIITDRAWCPECKQKLDFFKDSWRFIPQTEKYRQVVSQ